MADSEDTTQDNPDGENGPDQPDRDNASGRYKRRHEAKKDDDGKDDKEDDGKKKWLLLLLLLLILLLLLCAGFAYMKWWKTDPAADPSASTTPTVATTTQAPSPTPSVTATASPSPSASASASPSPSPAPKTVAMPNVVGMKMDAAKAALEAAGFLSIKFVAEDKPNDNLSLLVSYVVTRQSVPAGTQVPVNTALVITGKASSNGKG
jgi:cytoskeletal protein RodZ